MGYCTVLAGGADAMVEHVVGAVFSSQACW